MKPARFANRPRTHPDQTDAKEGDAGTSVHLLRPVEFPELSPGLFGVLVRPQPLEDF